MYRAYLRDKFPANPGKGLYKIPEMPAVKLGKLLMKETRVGQPGDVIAAHIFDGFFSSGYVLLTDTHCFYSDGSFLLEDVKTAQTEDKMVLVAVNHLGSLTQQNLKTDSEEAAHAISRVLEGVARYNPELDKKVEKLENDYGDYEGAELDWLKLRDEVMRTIDMLHERFNDGKLSLLEYEEKKAELLKRI